MTRRVLMAMVLLAGAAPGVVQGQEGGGDPMARWLAIVSGFNALDADAQAQVRVCEQAVRTPDMVSTCTKQPFACDAEGNLRGLLDGRALVAPEALTTATVDALDGCVDAVLDHREACATEASSSDCGDAAALGTCVRGVGERIGEHDWTGADSVRFCSEYCAGADGETLGNCGVVDRMEETVGEYLAGRALSAAKAGVSYVVDVVRAADICVVCEVLWIVVIGTHRVGAVGYGVLAQPMFVLVGVMGLLWTSWWVGSRLLTGGGEQEQEDRNRWGGLVGMLLRLGVVLLLLGALMAGGPRVDDTTVYDGIAGGVVGPAMSAAAGLGVELFGMAGEGQGNRVVLDEVERKAREFRVEKRATGGGVFWQAPEAQWVEELAGSVNRLAWAAHTVGILGLARAAGFLADRHGGQVGLYNVLAAVLGIVMAVMFVYFVVRSGMRMLGPVLRIALVLTLSPVLIAAYAFGWSRHAAHAGLRALAYAAVYLLLAGLVFALAVQVMLVGFAGVGAGSYAELVKALSEGGEAFLGNGEVDIAKVIVTFVTMLMAEGLMRSIDTVAGQVAQYEAQGGDVGEQVESQVGGVGSTMMNLTMVAGPALFAKGFGMAGRGGRAVIGWFR